MKFNNINNQFQQHVRFCSYQRCDDEYHSTEVTASVLSIQSVAIHELIPEILSWLPVKSFEQMKSVSNQIINSSKGIWNDPHETHISHWYLTRHRHNVVIRVLYPSPSVIYCKTIISPFLGILAIGCHNVVKNKNDVHLFCSTFFSSCIIDRRKYPFCHLFFSSNKPRNRRDIRVSLNRVRYPILCHLL